VVRELEEMERWRWNKNNEGGYLESLFVEL
jgi:hypothetical protein